MFNPIKDKEEKTTSFNSIYRGKVVDNHDPKYAGRVKVKVFGVFDEIHDDVLPWAIMADQTLGGLKNVGSSFIPEVDSHVFVFFEAGDHRYPVYFASAPALHDEEIPDLPNESRRDQEDLEGEEFVFPLDKETDFPFEEKEPADANSEYPYNKVFKTKSGHVIEIDDTEGQTRFRILHPSENEFVSDHEGHTEKVVKGNTSELFEMNHMRKIQQSLFDYIEQDSEVHIDGDKKEEIEGEVTITIGKDKNITIGGDFNVSVDGDYNIDVGGDTNITSSGDVNIQGSTINLN